MFRLKKPRIYSSVYILVKEHAFVLCVPSVKSIIPRTILLRYSGSPALFWSSFDIKTVVECSYASPKQETNKH